MAHPADSPATDPSADSAPLPRPSPEAALFRIDPDVCFLNHGSYGACPAAILDLQTELRDRMERESTRFFVEELRPLQDAAREALGAFLGANPDDLAFVPNATTAVNTVLRSLRFEPGDEILINNHEYPACIAAVEEVCRVSGARPVLVRLPWPVRDEDSVVEAILGGVTERTRLALLSVITSATGLVLPIERLVRELEARGVEVLVDGAHAPGMVPVDLDRLNAPYFTGNCHKWMYAPKGCAFLHVRRDRRERIRPLVVSLGSRQPGAKRDAFRMAFDFQGTADWSAYLVLPRLIEFMEHWVQGGWAGLRERQRLLALQARDLLCARLGGTPTSPDSMVGSLAVAPLPARDEAEVGDPAVWRTRYHEPLQDALIDRWRIQVPIVPFPAPPSRHVRVAAALHTSMDQVRYLASALEKELERERAARR